MNDQAMLKEFAILLAKSKERWPDAPTLPEGHRLDDQPLSVHGPHMYGPNMHDYSLDSRVAVSTCAVVALSIIQHCWANPKIGVRFSLTVRGDFSWQCEVCDWVDGAWAAKQFNHKDIASAALAGLRAIVGSAWVDQRGF